MSNRFLQQSACFFEAAGVLEEDAVGDGGSAVGVPVAGAGAAVDGFAVQLVGLLEPAGFVG